MYNNHFRSLNESFDKQIDEAYRLQCFKEQLEEFLSRLNEAPMSDEDKADSDIIRNLYKKIGGKKGPKLTPEEQKVLDKYGLDAWGFRGDTKVITPGKHDIVNQGEFRDHYEWDKKNGRYEHSSKSDKINYADRARKADSRGFGRKYARYWDDAKQQAERDDQAREMEKPLYQFKRAKSNYNDAKKDLDNYYTDLAKSIERADTRAMGNLDDARDLRYNKDREKIYDDKIQALLNKHRKKIESFIESLNEATSPEDKYDSDLLKGILVKLAKRSNAKLSPEELDVLRKYELAPSGNGIYHIPSKNYYNTNTYKSQWSNKTDSIIDPKYNLAGKLKKPENEYAKKVRATDWWWNNKEPFQAKERKLDNLTMGQDVSDMKDYLQSRNYYRDAADKNQKDLAAERARRAKERDAEIARLINPQRRKDAEDTFNKAKDKLNALRRQHGMPTEESLKESREAEHMTRIIPTNGDPKLNAEIIDSVIGQLSDGIWENSPGMEGYWATAEADDNGNIVIDDRNMIGNSWHDRPIENKYSRMSDDEVRRFFANKAKYVAQLYLHDHSMNPYKNWNAENTEECGYMGGHYMKDHDPTIGEIFEFVKNNK